MEPAYRIRLPLLEQDRNIDKPRSRPGQTQAARQISSAMNTPQGPRVCRDCNVALPITVYRQTCSTARSAIWTNKAASSFIGYQTVPFQWSLYAIDGDDVPHHREFLADGGDDPRRRFAETLIEAFAAFDDPILVYSVYEQTRLKELAGEYPDLSASLTALIARLVDPLPFVGGAVYFPEFRFSNSIQSVAQHFVSVSAMTTLRALPPAARHQPHSCSSHLVISRVPRTSILYALRSSIIATAITVAMVELHRALTRLALP